MKKFIWLSLSLCLIALLTSCANPFVSRGDNLFNQAGWQEKRGNYLTAEKLYAQALKEFRKADKPKQVLKCQYKLTDMNKITMTYTFTEEAVRSLIKEHYPETKPERIDQIIADKRLPQMEINGQQYYFSDFLNTLFHVYPEFRSKPQPGALGKSQGFFRVMSKYIYKKESAPAGQTFVNPINYLAEGKVTIPREKLPKSGLYKIWLPMPLTTAAQQNIEMISIEPRQYVKYPIKMDGDIGLVYLEIPLEEIKTDLAISQKFRFRHYEERFKVDPNKLGKYDTESPLYRRYTASGKNIAVTPSIALKAKELAGDETNPLKIAKIFFDHIIWDLEYSFTPHAALEALEIPESVFVHEHGYGDCGAQSMYFAALCRAMGIPARASGGWQLFPVNTAGCGSHFWAQIYLPNYGWAPIDTSAGQLGRYMPGLTDQQQKDFADYFFLKMDPFRYLIQHDVDIPFIPGPDGPVVFSMVLQDPEAVCFEMDENPGLFLMDNWRLKVRQL
ncbi:MAG: transglutaminase domain-containing protein [Candidatus Saganbacteria bacterium]|nr:transglutaminase domain-containing protein [Candidatus Saganbacteria bacterium]